MLAHLTWGSRCIYSRPITAHQDIETKSDLQESLWCNLEVTQVKKKTFVVVDSIFSGQGSTAGSSLITIDTRTKSQIGRPPPAGVS